MIHYKQHDSVRIPVDVQIPGWKTICTPGYLFTVEQVNDDESLVVSRSGPDGTVTVRACDMEPAYRVFNGISYSSRTPQAVVNVLENIRTSRQRIRVRLGDRATGRDWLEEHDVEGTIGNSTGPTKIPLLIHNRRSLGGPGLLDDAIVKISTTGRNRRTLYQHHNYHTGQMEIIAPTHQEYAAVVNVDGVQHAQFKTYEKAVEWVTKMGQ